MLLFGDGAELVHPFRHRLAQVIAGPAIGRVALLDEFALLPGQGQRRAMAATFRVRNRLQEHLVHVAIELREDGIGADRLFHLTFGRGAIEARQALLEGEPVQPFELKRNVLVIAGGLGIGRIEANGLRIILQRALAIAPPRPGRAALL